MQQLNMDSSPYAHAAFDDVLSILERYRAGEEELWDTLEAMFMQHSRIAIQNPQSPNHTGGCRASPANMARMIRGKQIPMGIHPVGR